MKNIFLKLVFDKGIENIQEIPEKDAFFHLFLGSQAVSEADRMFLANRKWTSRGWRRAY